MNCLFCATKVPNGKEHCPACKRPAFGHTGLIEESETTRLGNGRQKRTREPRYDVGMFNDMFGGGIARTSVNLVGGSPGAGKTTMFLQIADMVLDQVPAGEGDVLYIANEMSDEEVEEYAERIKCKHLDTGRIEVYNAMGGLRRDLGSILREKKPCLTILDSLTKLVGEDMAMAVKVIEWFKESTVALKRPTLIVNQVTKDGAHAGSNQAQHGGDGVFTLLCDDTTGERLLCSSKNRKGPAPVYLYLRMLPKDADRPGLLVRDPARYNADGSEKREVEQE